MCLVLFQIEPSHILSRFRGSVWHDSKSVQALRWSYKYLGSVGASAMGARIMSEAHSNRCSNSQYELRCHVTA